MMTRAIALVCALAATLPSMVAAQEPFPRVSGMDNELGSIRMQPYLRSDGGPVDVDVRVVLQRGAWAMGQAVLFAFDGHSDSAPIEFLAVEDAEGTPLLLHTDERSTSATQPKVLVATTELRPGETFTLRARVTPLANGKFHVGALVLPLDEAWKPMLTSDRTQLQLYAFAQLGTRSVDGGLAGPPFVGEGNTIPVETSTLVGLAVAMALMGPVLVLAGLYYVGLVPRPRRHAP